MRWLLSNLTSLILSLAMAMLVWVVAVQEADPVVERTLTQAPLRLVNQPPDTQLMNANTLPDSGQVDVRGPRSVVESIRPDELGLIVDLSQVGPGRHTLPVQVGYRHRLVEILNIVPADVIVEVQPIVDRELPVKFSVDGRPAAGFAQETPIISPTTVLLHGPAPAVNVVAEAVAGVSIAGARSTLEQVVFVTLLDGQGNIYSEIQPSPRTVTVTVPIHQLEDFREVAIKVNWEGQPAAGYRINKITLTPPTVLITGRPDLVDAVGVIETRPVDISDARGTIFKRVELQRPEGITVVDQSSFVTIEIEILAIESSVRVTKRLDVQGVGTGLYLIGTSPESVDVLLSGPLNVLENLGPDDVRVVLNLVGYGEGTFQVPPQVEILPQDVEIQDVLPGLIQVTISATPPVPTATPRP
jgi:YbbR domain-containing protein